MVGDHVQALPIWGTSISNMVTTQYCNKKEQGFPKELRSMADALFLDLLGPWKVRGAMHFWHNYLQHIRPPRCIVLLCRQPYCLPVLQ